MVIEAGPASQALSDSLLTRRETCARPRTHCKTLRSFGDHCYRIFINERMQRSLQVQPGLLVAVFVPPFRCSVARRISRC